MHYYIYPNGGNAKYIAWSIEFLNERGRGNNSYSFIDDKQEEISLKSMSKKIINDIYENKGKLLLSSPKYYDILLHKVSENGIFECYDGIKFYAKAINAYFKLQLKQRRVIAIQLSGFSLQQKHLGSIPRRLKNAGFEIVWVVSYAHYWIKDILEDFKARGEYFVLADCEVLEHLDFFPFILEQTNIIKFHTNVHSLKIVTSMEQISNRICSPKSLEDLLNTAFFLSNYLNIHSKSLYKEILKLQSFGGAITQVESRFIKGGYPSIEVEVEEFQRDRCEVKRDTIIFISAYLNFNHPHYLATIIHNVLNAGFRVVFKSCPPLEEDKKEQEDTFTKEFLRFANFIYWQNDKPRLSTEELNRSITAIELYSSMMYSYPVITKRPAILLYPKKESIPQDLLEQDCFYHKDLHIRIFEEDSK
ncbi:MAG: hypothetical protein K2I71_07685, partial [Helicobacter sp.]|nr:hypothetical protein [Helicobacter sp.]